MEAARVSDTDTRQAEKPNNNNNRHIQLLRDTEFTVKPRKQNDGKTRGNFERFNDGWSIRLFHTPTNKDNVFLFFLLIKIKIKTQELDELDTSTWSCVCLSHSGTLSLSLCLIHAKLAIKYAMQTALPGKKQTNNQRSWWSVQLLSISFGFWFVFILFYFQKKKKKTFETCYKAAVPFSRALVSVVFPSLSE